MKNQGNYKWEKSGAIGILSISNPPGNLIAEPDFIEEEQLNDLLSDKTIKGILIMGSGRHFSAGADLDNMRKLAGNKKLLEDKISKGRKLIRIIERAEIPVVAAIRGACFGGGLEIALACHVRICSENAMFAFPEINHGLIPGLGGSAMLSDLTGEGRSLEIILSGNVVDAQKALELKITDYVVPAKETGSFALKYLEDLTRDRDAEIIRSVMKSIHNSRTIPFEEALREETKLFCKLARRNLEELN